MNTATTPKLPKLVARKAHGDDKYSWAIFNGKFESVNGLTRDEVPRYKRAILRDFCEKNSVDFDAACVKLKIN